MTASELPNLEMHTCSWKSACCRTINAFPHNSDSRCRFQEVCIRYTESCLLYLLTSSGKLFRSWRKTPETKNPVACSYTFRVPNYSLLFQLELSYRWIFLFWSIIFPAQRLVLSHLTVKGCNHSDGCTESSPLHCGGYATPTFILLGPEKIYTHVMLYAELVWKVIFHMTNTHVFRFPFDTWSSRAQCFGCLDFSLSLRCTQHNTFLPSIHDFIVRLFLFIVQRGNATGAQSGNLKQFFMPRLSSRLRLWVRLLSFSKPTSPTSRRPCSKVWRKWKPCMKICAPNSLASSLEFF